MIKQYPLLQEKYIHLDFSKLRVNDIIYFCRDSLNHNIPKKLRSMYEKELLVLIQDIKKNENNEELEENPWLGFNWFAQDIDLNIILTYPVLNNAYSIVDYLLTQQYKVDNYNKQISHSLCACILIDGNMLHHLLSTYPLHINYKNDMLIKAYLFSCFVSENNIEYYFSHAKTIINHGVPFEQNFVSLIKHSLHDFNTPSNNTHSHINIIYHFLNYHPLPINDKIIFIDQICQLTKFSAKDIKDFKLEEKFECIEKWKLHFKLLEKLPPHDLNKKVKI